jgi:hypothetical protein
MSANIFGNRFYGHRLPAWHNLGICTEDDTSAVNALGLLTPYFFEKRPVTIFMNNELVEVGDYAIVRSPVPDDPKERNFGYATKHYTIVQPLEICEIFDENVKQPVETLGMLGKGEKLFLTWKMPEFDVKGDQVDLYGFVACGYDAKFGVSLNVVTTRVVCQNTWSIAVSEAEHTQVEGRGRIWIGRHNSGNIKRDLGIWMEHVQEQAQGKAEVTKALFNQFAEFPMEDKDVVYNLLFGIYPDPKKLPVDYPAKLAGEKQATIDELTEKAKKDRESVFNLFDGQDTAIDATAWGLFNSCTEFENWGRSTKKDASASIMIGNRANTMTRAASVIQAYVNKK